MRPPRGNQAGSRAEPDAWDGRRRIWRSAARRRGGGEVRKSGLETKPACTACFGRNAHRPASICPAAGRPAAPHSVPGSLLAHYNLGLALRQQGYYDDSLREYQLALDAGEDRRLNLQAMAEVHILRRDLSAALKLYDDLVKEHAESPKLWNERGVCLHQSGKAQGGSCVL